MASRWWQLIAVIALSGPACSPGGSSVATTSIQPAGVLATTADTLVSTVAPEPTGVPGLDDADGFCGSWAVYGATVQALGVAAAFGGLTDEQAAALELVAAPRLAEAAAGIDAAWPPELAAERTEVADQVIGPYARRAQRAVGALTVAGLNESDLVALRQLWQVALENRDPNVAVIAIPPIEDALQDTIGAAAAAFNASTTPFSRDPSLVVDGIATPATDSYLATHCPDLAASGVGDSL